MLALYLTQASSTGYYTFFRTDIPAYSRILQLPRLIVTAAVYWGFGSVLAHLPLTFQHWAGISPYTYSSEFAETYGFVNQSPGPFHCDPLLLPAQGGAQPRAPLLPKLRGHFAEFLNESSLAHLRILSSPTCVGLRYGHLTSH